MASLENGFNLFSERQNFNSEICPVIYTVDLPGIMAHQ